MSCLFAKPFDFCTNIDKPPVRITYESPATCNIVSHCFCGYHGEVYAAGLPPELREIASFQNIEIAA